MIKGFLFIIIFIVIAFALELWIAQLAVWGLSLYHVNSGIFGPFLIAWSLTGVITGGVFLGSRSGS